MSLSPLSTVRPSSRGGRSSYRAVLCTYLLSCFQLNTSFTVVADSTGRLQYCTVLRARPAFVSRTDKAKGVTLPKFVPALGRTAVAHLLFVAVVFPYV